MNQGVSVKLIGTECEVYYPALEGVYELEHRGWKGIRKHMIILALCDILHKLFINHEQSMSNLYYQYLK
jgi:hypothetical protein